MDKYFYQSTRFITLARLTLLLSFCVIVLGAYVRLSHAGLGCPDWPGCYGKAIVGHTQQIQQQMQHRFPSAPFNFAKAVKEMLHRYLAGTLGLLIVFLGFFALYRKFISATQPLLIPWLLVALVLFQIFLGKWTVTQKLLPIIVTLHLIGGVAIAALLWWLILSLTHKPLRSFQTRALKPWSIMALLIVLLQLFLGAWTSSNYAALVCPHFPFCQGSLLPTLQWKHAFNLTAPLDFGARVTVQMAHRYGALLTTLFLLPLGLSLIIKRKFIDLRTMGWIILLLLVLQITLGVLNILWRLPMATALAHNAIATLLLLSVITLVYQLHARKTI